MTKDYFFATGKRKTAVARVRLRMGGTGEIKIDEKIFGDYFTIPTHRQVILEPLKITGNTKTYDITVCVLGGGINAQAEAVRHGISKALIVADPGLRITLKKAGFLTRDARVKERKKYGLKRARRAPQWSKR